MELALLEEVKYGLSTNLKVFACFLQKRNRLTTGIKRPESMKFLIKTVNDGLIEMVHPHKHLLTDLWVSFLT